MRAIVIEEFGPPEVLQEREVARPRPGPGEVLLRVAAAGVNYADVRLRSGNYITQPKLPVVPGFEVSGYVEEVGEGAAARCADGSVLALGTPVIAGDAKAGYAEYALAPADLLFHAPEGRSLVDAAALPVNFLVAWLALHLRARVTAGERVLIHAAAGGVGLAAVQLAKLAGVEVVGTASSPSKLAVAGRAGVDVGIDYVAHDFVEAVREHFGEATPIDVVIDSVGGQTLVGSLDLLRPWGRYVGFGQAAEEHATLDLYRALIPKHLEMRFLGRGLLTASKRPDDRAVLYSAMDRIVRLWGSGSVEPVVTERFALGDAARAHAMLADRSSVGKLLVLPGEAS